MKKISTGALVLLMFLSATMVGGLIKPLSSAHWDSPIYLYQAKRFAETNLLQSYATHGAEISAQVYAHTWPAGEGFSEAFWRFMRLGHIVILGSVIKLTSDPLSAISASNWLYAAMLGGAVALLFLAMIEIGMVFDPRNIRTFTSAAIASVFLYILSPIYWYLSANFLSEIPALFLLAASLLAFVRGMRKNSVGLGALTGILLFMLYAVRMDSAWSAFAIMTSLAIAFRLGAPEHFSLRTIIAASAMALMGFVVYSFTFYPLTNPLLVVSMLEVLGARSAQGVPGYFSVFVAGGLLWIGAAWAILRRFKSPLSLLGIVWLVLLLVPRPHFLVAPVHSRMLADLVVPLLLLSTVGLAAIFAMRTRYIGSATIRGFTGAIAVTALLVAWAGTYEWLRDLPGGWRLQYVRALMVPPKYERNVYPVAELSEVSTAIYGDGKPTIVLVDGEIRTEFLNIVRFFGPQYPATSDLAKTPDPMNPRRCEVGDVQNGWDREPAIFCRAVGDGFLDYVESRNMRLLLMLPTAEEHESELIPAPSNYVEGQLVRNAHLKVVVLESRQEIEE